MEVFDIAAVVCCLSVLVFYHIFSFSYVLFFNFNDHFQLSSTLRAGYNWFIKHAEKQDAPSVTLAIQTLRNTILVAIFVGGQSFIYGFNILSSLSENSSIPAIVRSVILSTCLFLSFLCWANVIRLASHIGFYLSISYKNKNLKPAHVPSQLQSPTTSVGIELQHLENGNALAIHTSSGNLPIKSKDYDDDEENFDFNKSFYLMKMLLICFSFGFRFIFISIPFVFYILGPTALVVATFILILFLYIIEPNNHRCNLTKKVDSPVD